MMKKLLVLLSVFLLLGMSVQNTQANEGTFTVGMECNSAPYNWTQASQKGTAVAINGGQFCEGYDVQIAKIIAEKLNKELVIQKISWEGLILSTETGQIDAIIGGMSPTDERKKQIAFSNPYYVDELTEFGVVVKRDGPYAEAQGVKGFKDALITAQVGTFHPDLQVQLEGAQHGQLMLDFSTMTIALKSGEIDGFVVDNGAGEMINIQHPELVFIPVMGEGGFEITEAMIGISVGINKQNTQLLEDVNRALAEISDDTKKELMDAAQNAGETTEGNFLQKMGNIAIQNYPILIRGAISTLFISVTATIIGFIISLFIAMSRGSKVSNAIANVYITFFRGTPMMVQAMILYFGVSYLIPSFRWTNLTGGNLLAGVIIVSINTGAYLAETVRGGIQALDKGQFEAATSLGFSNWETMRHIILPQAIKNAIPALGNELIANVKDTSVLNIIGVSELFFVSSGISSANLLILETWVITSIIYLFLTTILAFLLRYIEMRLDKTKTRPSSYPTSMTDADNMA